MSHGNLSRSFPARTLPIGPGLGRRLMDAAGVVLCTLLISIAAHAGSSGPVRVWYYGQSGEAIEDCGTASVAYGAGPCGMLPGLSEYAPQNLGRCKKVAVGGGHFAAITVSDELRMWGVNDQGQCNVPWYLGPASQVSLGQSHTLAMSTDGYVAAWGRNDYGQCNVPFNLGVPKEIAAGHYHSLAIRANGTVRAWGRNDYGQSSVPTDLGACTQVAGGYGHSVALRADGSIRAWGFDNCGQVSGPTQNDMRPYTAMAAGMYSTTIARNPQTQWDSRINSWGCSRTSLYNNGGIPYRQVVDTYDFKIGLTVDGRVQGSGIYYYPNWWGWDYNGINLEDSGRMPANLGRCISIAGFCLESGNNPTRNFFIAIQDDDCDENGFADSDDIATGRGLDLNLNGRLDSCEIRDGVEADCNNDGRLDSFQIANLEVPDRNGNLVPDSCDVARGYEEDCDLNGVIDSYQQQLNAQISVTSSKLGPIGYGSPRTAVYESPAYAISDPLIHIMVLGDFSSPAEYLSVYMNGRFLGDAFKIYYGQRVDCQLTSDPTGYKIPMETWFQIPRDFFNDTIWADHGSLDAQFEFRPSIAVNANQCPTGSWVQVELSYTAAITEDCNANGLLDVCEVRDYPETDLNGNGICDACEGERGSPWCAGDLDNDGEVGGSDISMLLIRFGMSLPGDPADLDGDGEVSASDISALLILFGPC